jgi:hypothetical protein
VFVNIYAHIYNNQTKPLDTKKAKKTEIFILAFSLYQEIIGENQSMGINRAWFINQQLVRGDLCRNRCARCQSVYVSMSSVPELFKPCPQCDVTIDKSNRKIWKTMIFPDFPNKQKKVNSKLNNVENFDVLRKQFT